MVNHNLGWNRNSKIDFFTTVDEWTAEDYILRFWYMAQGYLVKRRGYITNHSSIDITDLQSLAVESLMTFANNEFADLCERIGATPTDPRLFWNFLKRRLNWDVSAYIDANTNDDQTIEDDEEVPSLVWMRTQYNRHVDNSTLHRQLVESLTNLDQTDQTLFALYYFEEMQREELVNIIGMSVGSINLRLRQAAERLLHAAMNLTTDLQPLTISPGKKWDATRADDWSVRNYGVPLHIYLHYVGIHYRADVSYLVDILNAANGIYIRRDNYDDDPRRQARNPQLTDTQVNEIRARLEAGEQGRTIANDYPVSEHAIYSIKRGQTYTYVPRDEEGAA